MTFLFGLITFWDKCCTNMSLGFNYFTAFPVLIQYMSATAVLICIQNKTYTKSIVPGTKSTTVNLNLCKLIVVI